MKIIWSPLALERVKEIARYIAADNPRAARKWVEAVFQTVERLEGFPESGRAVPEVGRKDIREILHGHYRIIYRLEPGAVAILTVRHGRQLLTEDVLGEV